MGIPWDGMGQAWITMGWDGMGQKKMSHGQACKFSPNFRQKLGKEQKKRSSLKFSIRF